MPPLPLLLAVTTPADLLPLLLLAAGSMWLIFGTITIRWSCSAINFLLALGKPAGPPQPPSAESAAGAAPAREPGKLAVPDYGAAVGIVILDGLIFGGVGLLLYCYQAAMLAMGGAMLPIQTAGMAFVHHQLPRADHAAGLDRLFPAGIGAGKMSRPDGCRRGIVTGLGRAWSRRVYRQFRGRGWFPGCRCGGQ